MPRAHACRIDVGHDRAFGDCCWYFRHRCDGFAQGAGHARRALMTGIPSVRSVSGQPVAYGNRQ
eukprot:1250949-Lingulodinium_polyedra.AAC.1